MKKKVIEYINKYEELVQEYTQLENEFIVDDFGDKIYYDALGYTELRVYINNATNRELLEAQIDLAAKVNDLKTILKNIKANQKLMNRINAIYA